jgi:phosphoribosylanthranilate isomerase
MKKIKIKVCGLTNYDDILFCLINKIDYIGLNFYKKSKRYICPENALNILNKINLYDSNTKSVGVFVNSSANEIIKIAKQLKLDYVQLHSDENTDFCNELKQHRLNIIKVFRVSEKTDLKNIDSFMNCSDFFLFDKKSAKEYGGTGETINSNMFKNISITKKFFLAGGLSLDNITDLIEKIQPYAIDINSKFETSPGIKDKNKIMRLLNILNN